MRTIHVTILAISIILLLLFTFRKRPQYAQVEQCLVPMTCDIPTD